MGAPSKSDSTPKISKKSMKQFMLRRLELTEYKESQHAALDIAHKAGVEKGMELFFGTERHQYLEVFKKAFDLSQLNLSKDYHLNEYGNEAKVLDAPVQDEFYILLPEPAIGRKLSAQQTAEIKDTHLKPPIKVDAPAPIDSKGLKNELDPKQASADIKVSIVVVPSSLNIQP
ncbi:hypothetical protein Salat_2676200 [Sesamum alatum]|uniref:Uncharacterized protein n=1 Tax=Sesamum alatum TaxID=300844 RepID=A0AAE1XPI8_9LAMI|nr:hypothetical protein Salat_2676200 [Sesamum alatum]